MYVALYKLANQSINKVIVVVPEKTIGRSFQNTNLKSKVFFTIGKSHSISIFCDTENEHDKIGRFKEFFIQRSTNKLVCTHATLRNAMKELSNDVFNDCLFAIDEFHHASASADSGLGNIVRDIMTESSAHIIAMTVLIFVVMVILYCAPKMKGGFILLPIIITSNSMVTTTRNIGFDYVFMTKATI